MAAVGLIVTQSRVQGLKSIPLVGIDIRSRPSRSSNSDDTTLLDHSNSNSNNDNDMMKKKKKKKKELYHNYADRVHSLPLYHKPLPAPQWSGLLNASKSSPGTYLHYYMAHYQAQGDDEGDEGRDATSDTVDDLSDDPTISVLFFFNGGPGASSMIGLFTELGPLILQEQGEGWVENPYAYTQVGHLVVLESITRGGVGYSFCQNWTDFTP